MTGASAAKAAPAMSRDASATGVLKNMGVSCCRKGGRILVAIG
jgi:hypothetical protein